MTVVQSVNADIDGDGVLETIQGTDSGETVVLKGGNQIWAANSPIDGWNRNINDIFLVADVDGDHSQEIVLANNNDGWTGVLKWQGGALHITWASPSPVDGWNRTTNDRFLIGDVDGDNHDEIVIYNNNDGWTGVLKWTNNALHMQWASPSPIDGWNRTANDHLFLVDIDSDSRQEIFIYNNNDGWTGLLKWTNNALHVLWASAPPLHGPAGDWNRSAVDTFAIAGPGTINVSGPNGWHGVLRWQNSALVPISITKDKDTKEQSKDDKDDADKNDKDDADKPDKDDKEDKDDKDDKDDPDNEDGGDEGLVGLREAGSDEPWGGRLRPRYPIVS